MSEAAEYRHWPNGKEKAPRLELDSESLAKLSETAADVSEKAFDDPVVRVLGRDLVELPVQTVEAIDAVEAATGVEVSKIGHDLPAFERKPLGEGAYRYTLRLPFTDEFDEVNDAEYVFNEQEKTLTKQRTTKPAQPVMVIENITLRDELASLHRRKGEADTQLTELLDDHELPDELREKWNGLMQQREEIAALSGDVKAEMKRALSDEANDFEAFGAAAVKEQEAQNVYEEGFKKALRELNDLGEIKGDDVLAGLTKGILIFDSLIKISQQRQGKLFGELDAIEEASKTVEIESATADNGIAGEFIRVMKALKPQDFQQ